MGCCNITKCIREQDLEDDDSSIGTASRLTTPGGCRVGSNMSVKSWGISQWSLPWDATKSFAKNVFTARQFTLYTSDAFYPSDAFTSFYPDFSLTEITPQLYLGSFEDAKNEAEVVELGITHILSLIGPKHPIKGIKHMHKPMKDNGHTNLDRLIINIWSFVMKSQAPGNKLLIHCLSGQNRSATVMVSILMKLKGEPSKLVDVYTLVKGKRPVVQINELYAKQLLELETDLFGTTTMSDDWMKIRSCDTKTGSVLFFD